MRTRRTALLTSIVVSATAAAVLSAPAQAAVNPCVATNRGKLRQPIGAAKHLVFAVSPARTSNNVAVTLCVKRGRFWRQTAFAQGRAGIKGFAMPGQKREGDGKAPTGSYTLTQAFGIANPGTRLPYRKLRRTGDCWGSTPRQPHYNQYYAGHCRATDENLSAYMQSGQYRQAVVINYNRPRVIQGYGSAIFLHVGGTRPTAGCIAIPLPKLRLIMRTLTPRDRIIMGPAPTLFRP